MTDKIYRKVNRFFQQSWFEVFVQSAANSYRQTFAMYQVSDWRVLEESSTNEETNDRRAVTCSITKTVDVKHSK